MPFDPRDLERMQQDGEEQNYISETVFCGSCGYQLKMLPKIGRCPECGNHYNTLRRMISGVFTPQTVAFPAFDTAAAIASTWLLIWLIGGLLQVFDLWGLMLTITFAVLAPIFIKKAYTGIVRYWHGMKLTMQMYRAVEEQEEE